MARPITYNLHGKRFGRLEVTGYINIPGRTGRWTCRCDCGNVKNILARNLYSGMVNSCGCWQREKATADSTTHGMNDTREHRIWRGAKTRCFNPKEPFWLSYGGRGITMCERWKNDFAAFFADMGPSNGLELDRIDNNGNYEPGNCRWATRKQQTNNTRRTRFIENDGKRLPVTEWGRLTGINSKLIRQRLDMGFSVEHALTPGRFKTGVKSHRVAP